MEELRLLVSAALELPIHEVFVQQSIVGWIALGVTLVSAGASIYGQYSANQDARETADAQEALTEAQAAAKRKDARFQYQQAKDQAKIARTDAENMFDMAEDSYAMSLGSNAAGYRQARQELGLQRDQTESQYEQQLEQIERSRKKAISDVQMQTESSAAQLAAAGGRSGTTRSRLMDNIKRATGQIAGQTAGSIGQTEDAFNFTNRKLDISERSALRKKRSGIVGANQKMERVENEYNKLMGGEGYGEGTIAERMQSAKQQRDRVIGAGDYAASEMDITDYSGGFGTADFMKEAAALQRQSVYDQTGWESLVGAGVSGGATGLSMFNNLYDTGTKYDLWG